MSRLTEARHVPAEEALRAAQKELLDTWSGGGVVPMGILEQMNMLERAIKKEENLKKKE